MRLLRYAARPLLAGIFISGGYDTFRNPATRVPMAESVAPKIADGLGLPASTEQLVQMNAVVQIVGGAALALGVFPRLAAIALAGSLVPTTLAGHAFWELDDPKARAQQRGQFFKNASILGGLLAVIAAG
jgi:uncharacterized membrane protein YphA (DoxX/SURF4 family)